MLTMLALIGSASLCLVLALVLKVFFHELWWAPKRLSRFMGTQGIRGPPYRFIHGTTKEVISMQKEATSKPMPGLSHDVFPRLQPHIHRWIKAYGKNYLQWNGSRAQLVITNPELIKDILNDRERLFHKEKFPLFAKRILGDGLAVCEGEKWVKLRKLANYAFQAESLKVMTPAMIASVEEMFERWKYREGKEIDVYQEFRLLSAEVISRTAFGSSYLEGKAIFETLEKLTLLASRNLLKQRIPGISKIFKTGDQIESEKLEKGIHNLIKEIIKKREEKVLNGEEDSCESDYLGALLKAHRDADKRQRVSVDEMVDECKTFYFAGQETTNTLLSWTVFLLAVHADWQEEARKEVLELFGKQHPKPDGISKLKYMSMIINESLRLYPPITAMARKTGREMRLGDLNLPANIVLYMPVLALHHDPEIWGDDVHLFKPERFSEGVAKATKNNFAAFFPFGMGPRICVGFNFAITETKIALAMILQRYTFTLSPAYVHSPAVHFTARPQYGLQVILNPC